VGVLTGCGSAPDSLEPAEDTGGGVEDEPGAIEEEGIVTVQEETSATDVSEDLDVPARAPDPQTVSAARVTGALNAFALDVYAAAHPAGRSWVLSPPQHADALARLAARRGGRTTTELALVLHADEIGGPPGAALARESNLLRSAAAVSVDCLADPHVRWAARAGSLAAARGRFSYAHHGGAQVVEVPAGERASLLVVVPDRADGLARVEARLPALLTRWLDALAPVPLEVTLPAAVLGAACPELPAETSAAAAGSPAHSVAADRPFLYFVGDRRTGLVLRMGRFVGRPPRLD
jgi:serine protease inhibitor